MFDFLVRQLADFWSVLLAILGWIQRNVSVWVAWLVWAWVILFDLLRNVFDWLADLLLSLVEKIDSIAAQLGSTSTAVSGIDWGPLAVANSILPITEILTLVGAYFAIAVLCAFVRIIKSFIPTVS